MSWYELSLYLDRLYYRQKKASEAEELELLRWRVIVADFRNANFRSKKSDKVWRPKDIVKLQFDEVEQNDNTDTTAAYLKQIVADEAIKRKNGQK